MSKFYNQLRSLKGTAIGTITGWSGDIGSVPSGWTLCNGNSLQVSDYPELFAVIGYQYGGSGESFVTPKLLDRAIVDYHPTHSNIPGIGLNNDFISRMGVDTANSTSGATSNIDLYVNLDPVNNLVGRVTDIGINPSGYTDDISVVPRVLGDHHIASHSHTSQTTSALPTLEYGEECQNNDITNCGVFELLTYGRCQDDCDHLVYWPSEDSGNLTWSSIVTPSGAANPNSMGISIRAGNPFDINSAPVNGWPSSYIRGQFTLQNTPNKNYMIPGDDTLQNGANANGTHPYPVHLNHAGVNFGGTPARNNANTGNAVVPGGSQTPNFAFGGHDHPTLPYSITLGNIKAPNVLLTNNMSTGSVTPLNSAVQDIASVRIDNINTPSLSVIYIIRAY
jgi:hypothetical protein